MPIFVYKAKKNSSDTVTGEISAQSEDEAIELLNQLGLLPVTIEMQTALQVSSTFHKKIKTVKLKERYLFSRQLANLLKSGLSLVRALAIVEEQTSNILLRQIIGQLIVDIKNGKSFSEALVSFERIFSPLYIIMVRAGEEGSNLQEMLLNIATYQKKQEDFWRRIRTALAYPIFMAIVGFLTVWYILTFVLPKMGGLFINLGNDLPVPTTVLLAVSGLMQNWWPVIFVVLGVIVLAVRGFVRSTKGQRSCSRFELKIPVVGGMLLKADMARFSRTLILLSSSGLQLTKALPIAIPVLRNMVIRERLLECHEHLTTGGSFGQKMRQMTEFPSVIGHLFAIGEESGNLVEVMHEMADIFEQETDEAIKMATTLFEPLMILLVGGMIGGIVFAMLLPIFQMDMLMM